MELDLDEDTGALWHAASQALSAEALQQTVAGLAVLPLTRRACWFPLHYVPAPLLPLLQPYLLERPRPTGWRWEAMPPSVCLPEGFVERLSQRLTAALWCVAGERLRPDVLATLLERWLDAEPAYAQGELIVLDPLTHGQAAYEALLGVLRARGLTEIDWHDATSLAMRDGRYEHLTQRLQQHLVND